MKHKTRTERVYNEATGWYETREVELKGYTFTDDDRILIVREYLESGVPAEKIIKKYWLVPLGGSDYHGYYISYPHPLGTCTTPGEALDALMKVKELNK